MAIRTVPLSEALEKGYKIIGPETEARETPPSWLEMTQLVAAELIPSMGGAIIGSFAGPGGAAAGGMGGSALGNLWAQNLRQDMGLSDQVHKGELIAATATGAIPLGKLANAGMKAKIAARAAQGAGMAELDLITRTAIDEQRLPTAAETKTALLFGGTIGGGLGAIEAKFFRDATGVKTISEDDTRADVQLKLMNNTDDVLLLENKQAKQLTDDIQYGTAGETGLYERPISQSTQVKHPAYISEMLTPEQAKKWQQGKLTEAEKLAAVDGVIVKMEDIAEDTLNNVSPADLPQHVLMQAEVPSSAWMKASNLPVKSTDDLIGIPPAPLNQQSVSDLKAAMTGLSSQNMEELDKLSLLQKGVKSIDVDAQKGGKSWEWMENKKRERSGLVSEEKKIVADLQNRSDLQGAYLDEYGKAIELEDSIDHLETLMRNSEGSERKKYLTSIRKLKQELNETRNQLPKEEQMAKDFLPANKFAQYVASGGLMAGLPMAYFEDEDGEYSLASGMSIAAGLTALGLALALGRSGKNVARSVRQYTKDLRRPKVKQKKANGRTKNSVPVEDQPIDYHEKKVVDGYTRPYQHSKWQEFKDHLKQFTGNILTPLSRRLKNLNPMIARAMQGVDNKINIMKRDLKIQSLFMYAMEDAAKKGGWMDDFRRAYGMEGAEGARAINQLFANNKKAITSSARQLAKKQGLENASKITLGFGAGTGDYTHAMYRQAMDNVYREMGEANMDVGYREGYNPRLVKDYKQFRAYLEEQGADYKTPIDAALANYAKQNKISVDDISDFEEAQIVSRLFADARNKERGMTFQGERKFTRLDQEMMDAYHDPGHALSSYFQQAAEKIHARKFLGKGLTGRFDTGMQKIDDSLAGQMAKSVGKEYGINTPEQLRELQEIIQKRFNSAPSDPLVQMWKNSNYFTTIANVGTTITQLMDLVNTFYFAGAGPTFRAIMNRGKKDWFNEMGLDRANGVDFGATAGGVNKILNDILTATGFNQIDKWAKNVSLEALHKKYRAQALKDPGKLIGELSGEFGPEQAERIVNSLQTWKGGIDGKTPTPSEIQHLLFAKASDFLPLSRAEMPGAAEGKFAPLFYQLKTYTIKQLDIYREINQGKIGQAVKLLGQGKAKEAAQVAKPAVLGLAKYGSMLALAGATTDTIKDLFYGRPVELDDTVQNNLVRLALINRYHMYRMERDGVGKALLDFAMPATTTIDRISKDISAFVQGEDIKGHSLQGTILDPIYWGIEGMGGYEKSRK